MKKPVERLETITDPMSFLNMLELFVFTTVMFNYGGDYRLNHKDAGTGERMVFCGRLFATLQVCHRKPWLFNLVFSKKSRKMQSKYSCL